MTPTPGTASAAVPVTRGRHRPPPGSWGHWILVIVVLGSLAAALVAQHELTADPAGPVGTAPASVTASGPVLAAPGGRLAGLAARPGTVSLTFTTGSGASLAPQLTAALRRLGIRGTFFIPAGAVAQQRTSIQQQVTAGDEVGLALPRTATTTRLPGWRLGAALTTAQYALQRAGAPDAALVRVSGPATAMNAGSWDAARRVARLGYAVVLTRRGAPLDGRQPAGLRARPGMVLALPDSGQPGRAALRSLPGLVASLRGAGDRFTTVSAGIGLVIQPSRVSALSAAGAAALLRAGQAAVILTAALGWLFYAAAGLILGRLVLLIGTGAWHKRRDRAPVPPCQEPVSVIIPAYNEHAGIIPCLRSMLFCDYPRSEVILVDDGSTDGTADLVAELRLPVTIVRQANAGKAAALNAGIRHARHDLLVLADGDTVFEPATIGRLVAPFRDPRVGAVAGNVKVANRRRLLGQIQHAEYVAGSSLDRRMYDVLGCMVTIPGAVGAFRREAIAQVGGVPRNTLAEDTDLTIAIGEAGWRVRYAAQARAWTEAPSTVGQLWAQRHRWTYGTMQSLWKHRRTVLSPARRSPSGRRMLAWVGLPYLFLMACVLPLISPAADVYVLVELWSAPRHAATLWATFVLVQGLLTLVAFALDRERLRYLWTLPFQQVFYRQLMYLVVLHSMATALTGVRLPWHKLTRIGVEVPDP
jgi:cellulose synthase/poly-beta-1,6-N-acetylglucosamine synthase-like glycosyltransferase/peptidoglycan/xylan/chitin deacetylase (PgdA/CDA1 family)